jgi:biotin-(acetyl-CoA carboxylase) ligase
VGLPDRVEEGVAEDVDENGCLLLRRADGSLVTIEAGDVTLRA